MKKYNVILTSYNRTTLLHQAIESVLTQTYFKRFPDECRLFIIDDGSPQATRDIINQFLPNPQIEYIQTDKKDEDRFKVCDYSFNINTCLQLIKNPEAYVFYLVCDDWFHSEHVELLSKALDENPEWMIVFGPQDVIQYDDVNNTEYYKFTRLLMPVVPQAPCHVDHIQVAHRRRMIDTTGYWPDNAAHYGAGDAAFWTNINKTYPFYRATMRTTNYNRHHKNSIQGLG